MSNNNKALLTPLDLNGIYKDIAEEFDVNIAKGIFEKYGGLQVSFPAYFVSSAYRHTHIKKEYEKGVKVKTIAKEYGYSERHVRRILKSKI